MEHFYKVLIFLSLFAKIKSEKFVGGGKVCSSVRVSGLDDLEMLKGCRVVEGSVVVGPIFYNQEDFSNSSFPDLLEITDNLMIYGVPGLKSVGQLFPSLNRIHGNKLFHNYSLVVFQNFDLENVGLANLKTISRGAVRIEGNEMLCYVNTVNWSLIVQEEFQAFNIFQDNMMPEVCPKCRTAQQCWSQSASQLECECDGNSCNANGTCCEKGCISCDSQDSKSCTVCRKNIVGNYPHQKCVESCPQKTYEYLGYRCVIAPECRNFNIINTTDQHKDSPFVPFQSVCQQGCPSDFRIKYAVDGNKMSASCTPCVGKECWKSCSAPIIDTIEAARQIKNCQVIEGSLNIELGSKTSAKITEKELQDSLSEIREIEGFLKVRSKSITSLSFLENLQVIKGNELQSNKYSLIIWGNPKLQQLFRKDQQIDIEKGKMLIHLNPKLCFDEIEKVAKGGDMIENYEVAKSSNGGSAICNVSDIQVKATEVLSTGALLQWQAIELESGGPIFSYVIYHTEAPDADIESFDEDQWNSDDTTNFDVNGMISFPLVRLKPNTRYAYYVRAFTLASDKVGFQSKIAYFTTLPGTPAKVRALRATAKSSTEIQISWTAPEKLDGEFDRYELTIRKLNTMRDFIKERDYCNEPVISAVMSEAIHRSSTLNTTHSFGSMDEEFDPVFEDELQDHIYIKNIQKRELRNSFEESSGEGQEGKDLDVVTLQTEESDEFTFDNLDHFSFYEITATACRKAVSSEEEIKYSKQDRCGPPTEILTKTLKNETADDISVFDVQVLPSNSSKHEIMLSWVPPANPNGFILNYDVLQINLAEKNSRTELICLSLIKRPNITSQIIDGLEPGKYSIQLSVITLAGQGNYTTPRFVTIPSVSHFSIIASPFFMILMFLILASVGIVLMYTAYKRHQPREDTNRLNSFISDDNIFSEH